MPRASRTARAATPECPEPEDGFAGLTALPKGVGITAARRAELSAALHNRLGAAKDARAARCPGSARVAQLMQSMAKWGAGATMTEAGVTAETLSAAAATGTRAGGRSARAISRATGVTSADIGGIVAGAGARRAAKRQAARAARAAERSASTGEDAEEAAHRAARNVPAPDVSFGEGLTD